MARVKRGVIARARHKKILKQAKGYYGARSRVYRVALADIAVFDKVAFTALVEKAKAALA